MRRAAIDVGTHSVRLLVADVDHGQIRPVLRRLEITRLGEGLDAGRVLIPQAIGRTVQAVREFWRIAHAFGLAPAAPRPAARAGGRDLRGCSHP